MNYLTSETHKVNPNPIQLKTQPESLRIQPSTVFLDYQASISNHQHLIYNLQLSFLTDTISHGKKAKKLPSANLKPSILS